MVICFNADVGGKIALDNLLNTGQFRDLSEAVCTALINYDIIQRDVGHSGHVMLSRAELLSDASQYVRGSNAEALPAQSPRPSPGQVAKISGTPKIPDIFITTGKTFPAADSFPVVPSPSTSNEALTPKEWLFGQFNKLLPLKATTRGLLNLQTDAGVPTTIGEARSTISTEAWVLGDFLFQLEEAKNVKRDDAVSTAFPTTLRNGGAGKSRYANQFVASVNSKGEASSLPIAFGFVVHEKGKISRLQLTGPGMEFALLENPVIDGQNVGTGPKFSDAERKFLVRHILRFVPAERAAYSVVLDALADGAASPGNLDSRLASRFHINRSSMSPSFLAMQRGGVISRLIDLGLVARDKEGIRVAYFLTATGKELRQQLADK